MDELFRFLMLRPPEPGDPVKVDVSEKFRNAVAQAQQQYEGYEALRVAARAISKDLEIASFDELSLAPKILRLADRLRAQPGAQNGKAGKADLDDLVEEELGDDPAAVIKSKAFAAEWERLADLLVAAKILSRDGAVPAVRIEDVLRTMDLVRLIAKDKVDTLAEARRAQTRPTVVAPGAVSFRPDQPDRSDPVDSGAGRENSRPWRPSGSHSANWPTSCRASVPTISSSRPRTNRAKGHVTLRTQPMATQSLAERPRERATDGAAETPSSAAGVTVGAVPKLMISPELSKEWSTSAQQALTTLDIDLAETPVPTALDTVIGSS